MSTSSNDTNDGKDSQECQSKLVSSTALRHYSNVLPKKGKPTPGKEWTVYAAIVATHNSNDNGNAHNAWVVSCATGSKCTAVNSALSSFSNVDIPPCANSSNGENLCRECCCQEQMKGLVLHDSHAEVLARRGLLRVLWREIHRDLNGTDVGDESSKLLLQRITTCTEDEPKRVSYDLKAGIQLHLYISDSPCGDASIYDISPEYNVSKGGGDNDNLNFTGAKIIVPSTSAKEASDNFTPCGDSDTNNGDAGVPVNQNNVCIARERHQITSALRLKSGRSNLPNHLRSSSMSCSDKICKWIVLGLQGSGIISSFLLNPIFLRSVVVSRDERANVQSQLEALKRALVERSNQANEMVSKYHQCKALIPNLHICNEVYPQGKAAAEKDVHDRATSDDQQGASKKRKLGDGSTRSPISQPMAKTQISPIGISINWQTTCQPNSNGTVDVEQTVGAKGIKQGKKPKRIGDVLKCSSRLSRHQLFQDALSCIHSLNRKRIILKNLNQSTLKEFLLEQDVGTVNYQKAKLLLSESDVRKVKAAILKELPSPLAGWVSNSDDHDFQCHANYI